MLVHEQTNNLVIIESDHNSYSYKVKKELMATLQMDEDEDDGQATGEGEDSGPSEAFIGSPEAGPGKWASCIRIVDPVQGETVSLLELEDNEAAVSVCITRFAVKPGESDGDGSAEPYLVVGTVKDYQIQPPKCPAAFLRVYKFVHDSTQIQLVHKVTLSKIPDFTRFVCFNVGLCPVAMYLCPEHLRIFFCSDAHRPCTPGHGSVPTTPSGGYG